MDDTRKQKIINYFIILQSLKFNRKEASTFFLKYKDVLNRKFTEAFFNFESEDKNKLSVITEEIKKNANSVFSDANGEILFIDDDNYPEKLRNLDDKPIAIFYKGKIELLNDVSVSVVGTRKPSQNGCSKTIVVARVLASKNICVVSGLAKGIDTYAHRAALDIDYTKVIGVIGTPLVKYYPKENEQLQKAVSQYGLLLTEYPLFENTKQWNFLRRNYLMSGVSDATIVIEAGDTSGAINQARSTLKNGRYLFIPSSNFSEAEFKWPANFQKEYSKALSFSDKETLINYLDSYILVK